VDSTGDSVVKGGLQQSFLWETDRDLHSYKLIPNTREKGKMRRNV
jgi:hypothetical protein